MEEDDGIARAEVVLHRPFDSEGALVAEIDGDRDLTSSGAGGETRRGWLVESGGGLAVRFVARWRSHAVD